MQSQIRYETTLLDFYTVKWIASPLAGRSLNTRHVLEREEERSSPAFLQNRSIPVWKAKEEKESFLLHSQDVSIPSQPLSAAFCLTGNPGVFWKSYFQHFSEGVGLVLPTEPGMSMLGNHQHAPTIPDTQLLRQGCNSSATKLGKDISGVTLLNPSVLHRSCPVSRL